VDNFCCVDVGNGHGTGVPSTTGLAECCGADEARGGPPAGGPAAAGLYAGVAKVGVGAAGPALKVGAGPMFGGRGAIG